MAVGTWPASSALLTLIALSCSLGSPEKKVQDEELNNRLISRKSVTLSKDISKGEVFKLDMLTMKRPGLGLKANQIKKILGKKAKKNLKKDYQLSINDF